MLLRYISYYEHENKLEVGNIEYLVPPIPPVILWSLLCVWWVLGVGTGHPLLTGPVCCLIVVSLPPIIATPGSARTVSCLITLTPWSSPRSECLLLVVCLSVCMCLCQEWSCFVSSISLRRLGGQLIINWIYLRIVYRIFLAINCNLVKEKIHIY